MSADILTPEQWAEVEAEVATWPPLTDDQISTLRMLLMPAVGRTKTSA